jgi:hypothetical protein
VAAKATEDFKNERRELSGGFIVQTACPAEETPGATDTGG